MLLILYELRFIVLSSDSLFLIGTIDVYIVDRLMEREGHNYRAKIGLLSESVLMCTEGENEAPESTFASTDDYWKKLH